MFGVMTWMLAAAVTDDALTECRRAQQEFAVERMADICRVVADDPARDVASRIYALRVLGGAEILKGDKRAAEMVLMRMLSFDIDAAAAPDDGPDFRVVLESARGRVAAEGVLSVTVARAADVVTGVSVKDPLARVARVELVRADTGGAIALARLDQTPGLATYVMPAGVATGEIVLKGWTGKVLRRLSIAARAGDHDDGAGGASGAGGAGPLVGAPADAAAAGVGASPVVAWSMIAGGALIAGAGAVVAGGAVIDANAAEPCSADPVSGCVPNRALLFGIYATEQRSEFFDDYYGWIAGSATLVVVGAALAAGGATLVATAEASTTEHD